MRVHSTPANVAKKFCFRANIEFYSVRKKKALFAYSDFFLCVYAIFYLRCCLLCVLEMLSERENEKVAGEQVLTTWKMAERGLSKNWNYEMDFFFRETRLGWRSFTEIWSGSFNLSRNAIKLQFLGKRPDDNAHKLPNRWDDACIDAFQASCLLQVATTLIRCTIQAEHYQLGKRTYFSTALRIHFLFQLFFDG